MTEADLHLRGPFAPPRPLPRTAQREEAPLGLPVALMDGAARQRYALGVQRTAGNGAMSRVAGSGAGRSVQRETPTSSEWDVAPNPYATTQKGGGAKTEIAGNPYALEDEPVTLSNPRFVGEPRLEKIAAGGAALNNADKGRTVTAVQGAMIDLGFELVQHERDGDFGPETQTAIRLFRERRSFRERS